MLGWKNGCLGLGAPCDNAEAVPIAVLAIEPALAIEPNESPRTSSSSAYSLREGEVSL